MIGIVAKMLVVRMRICMQMRCSERMLFDRSAAVHTQCARSLGASARWRWRLEWATGGDQTDVARGGRSGEVGEED